MKTDTGQRASAEIEITPEMLEAGLAAMREWLDPNCWDHLALRDAFLAMNGRSRQSHSQKP